MALGWFLFFAPYENFYDGDFVKPLNNKQHFRPNPKGSVAFYGAGSSHAMRDRQPIVDG